MSQHLVSKDTIDALVTAALTWGPEPDEFWYRPIGTRRLRKVGLNQATETGEMLWRKNWEMAEWAETGAEYPTYEFEAYPGTPDPVVILKTIAYYEYQTSDVGEIWESSEAAGFMRWLRSDAIVQLAGWEEAPWGIDDREAFSGG